MAHRFPPFLSIGPGRDTIPENVASDCGALIEYGHGYHRERRPTTQEAMMIRVRDARISAISAFAAGALMMTTLTLSHASPQDDAKAVAALDTEYQAAVKNNDTATMDRILADDFILLTGRGKVYNKADLLKSARDKDAVYEHHEGVALWAVSAAHVPYNNAVRAYFLLVQCRDPVNGGALWFRLGG
jgi:hypothetical protein